MPRGLEDRDADSAGQQDDSELSGRWSARVGFHSISVGTASAGPSRGLGGSDQGGTGAVEAGTSRRIFHADGQVWIGRGLRADSSRGLGQSGFGGGRSLRDECEQGG